MTTNCSTIICFVRENDKECQLVNDQVVFVASVSLFMWLNSFRLKECQIFCYNPTTNAATFRSQIIFEMKLKSVK